MATFGYATEKYVPGPAGTNVRVVETTAVNWVANDGSSTTAESQVFVVAAPSGEMQNLGSLLEKILHAQLRSMKVLEMIAVDQLNVDDIGDLLEDTDGEELG